MRSSRSADTWARRGTPTTSGHPPDGNHVYVGAETFLGRPGGIDVWDVSDLEAPAQVGRIEPPDVDAFRTAHIFDVTANRLHASWYAGGVRVYDVTDPIDPVERAHLRPRRLRVLDRRTRPGLHRRRRLR
jgi:hypothetical protein